MYWIRSGIEILPSRRSLAVVAGMKKPNDHAEPTKKSNVKKTKQKNFRQALEHAFANIWMSGRNQLDECFYSVSTQCEYYK